MKLNINSLYAPIIDKPTPSEARDFLYTTAQKLKLRLEHEQKYSCVIDDYQEKRKVLSNFLKDSGKQLCLLNATEKRLEIIRQTLELKQQQSKSILPQIPQSFFSASQAKARESGFNISKI